MGKRGPRPKTETELKQLGTFRADFHGSRGTNMGFAKGSPVPPRRLTAEEQEVWDHVCRNVPTDLISPTDSHSLAALAWWHCYVENLKDEVLRGIDDKAHKKLKDAQSVVTGLWSKFGMTPVDRARMLPTGPGEEKEENPLLKLMRIRDAKRKQG